MSQEGKTSQRNGKWAGLVGIDRDHQHGGGEKDVLPEGASEGWFYRQAGQICGPVSQDRLRELLGAGRLSPRQAVWQRGALRLFFVHADTVACAGSGESQPGAC